MKYFSLNNTPTVVVFTGMTKLSPKERRKKIVLNFQAHLISRIKHPFFTQCCYTALQILNLTKNVVFFFCLRQKQIQESGFPWGNSCGNSSN